MEQSVSSALIPGHVTGIPESNIALGNQAMAPQMGPLVDAAKPSLDHMAAFSGPDMGQNAFQDGRAVSPLGTNTMTTYDAADNESFLREAGMEADDAKALLETEPGPLSDKDFPGNNSFCNLLVAAAWDDEVGFLDVAHVSDGWITALSVGCICSALPVSRCVRVLETS